MRALVLSHAEINRLSVRDIFRSAYMQKFSRDMPPDSLEEDVRNFNKTGNVPQYVIQFFLNLIGRR